MYREQYKGHTISVYTIKRSNGWVATYKIDAGEIRPYEGRPLFSEQIVQQSALDEARRTIDHLPKTELGI